MSEQLYFIAVIPDEEICREVTRFKQYAARHFNSRRALRSPPHITLIPPFRWANSRLSELESSLGVFSAKVSPFRLDLHHFGSFPGRVIFVEVLPNERLSLLQQHLEKYLAENLQLSNGGRKGFHPHMTIAFKDLKRSVFPAAWAYFSRQVYVRTFAVSALVLLQHQASGWVEYGHFPFSGQG